MAEESRLTLPRVPQLFANGLAGSRTWGLVCDWYGLPLVALLGLLAATYYVISPEKVFPIFDDSYISLTYARNLAEHGKLSFDGETWSTGATSPLHVFTLAFVMKLGVDPFKASIWVGVFGHVLLSTGVYLLAWSIFRSRLAALLGGAIIAFTSYAVLDAGNGLETSLFMAMLAFTMASFFLSASPRGRLITGLLLALSVWTRPEAGFLIPAVLIYRWLDRDAEESLGDFVKDALRLCGPPTMAFVILSGYSLAATGSLGGTASTKLYFFQEYDQPLRQRTSIAFERIGFFLGPVVPLLVLAFAAGRKRPFLLFAMFWLPILVVYTVTFPGGLAHYFYRYQHPMLPLLAAMAGGGASYIIWSAVRSDVAMKLVVAVGLIILALPLWHEYTLWRDVYEDAATENRTDLDAMARQLNTLIRPDEVLATHDIGAVGYYADYKVLDLVGLANADVVEYHDGRRVAEYLAEAKPDYLLLFPQWDEFFLHIFPDKDPEHFELIEVFEGGRFRQMPYNLYRVSYD